MSRKHAVAILRSTLDQLTLIEPAGDRSQYIQQYGCSQDQLVNMMSIDYVLLDRFGRLWEDAKSNRSLVELMEYGVHWSTYEERAHFYRWVHVIAMLLSMRGSALAGDFVLSYPFHIWALHDVKHHLNVYLATLESAGDDRVGDADVKNVFLRVGADRGDH